MFYKSERQGSFFFWGEIKIIIAPGTSGHMIKNAEISCPLKCPNEPCSLVVCCYNCSNTELYLPGGPLATEDRQQRGSINKRELILVVAPEAHASPTDDDNDAVKCMVE